MDQNKVNFLNNDLIPLLKKVDVDAKPLWGKMNAQQMVEHLIESLKQANGKSLSTIKTPAEHISKMKSFLLSDTPFKENTKHRELPEEPLPTKCKDINEAITQLDVELKDFFKVFEDEPGKIIDNSVFGDLDYEHWVALLYKHAKHHLKQFSIN